MEAGGFKPSTIGPFFSVIPNEERAHATQAAWRKSAAVSFFFCIRSKHSGLNISELFRKALVSLLLRQAIKRSLLFRQAIIPRLVVIRFHDVVIIVTKLMHSDDSNTLYGK